MKINFPAVLDGGLSFPLEEKKIRMNTNLWTAELLISKPELIREVHINYIDSGAKIITTSSYQASFKSLKKRGYSEIQSKNIILKSVEIVEEIKKNYNNKIIIAASIGPYGSYLADGSEYVGNYDINEETFFDFYKKKVDLLDSSSADVLAFETIPSYKEAKVISNILKETKKQSWISFSCKNQKEISDGTKLEKCCEYLNNHSKIFGVGVNCTSPKYISKLISILKRKLKNKKIIIYPNSGEIYDGKNKNWIGNSNITFESYIDEWLNLGVDILGGCCRVGTKEIKKIKDKIDLIKN